MSLFGSTPAGQSRPSLFPSSAQAPQASSSLFGQSQSQSQPASSSLFGQQQQQQQQQPQQQNQPSNSLFGNFKPAQSQPFGSTVQQQQPQSNLFGGSIGQQNQSLSQPQSSASFRNPNQSLWQQAPSSLAPREKSVVDQMAVLRNKWAPETQECCFQYYFYNTAAEDKALWFGPEPGEDEQKWEEALAKRPEPKAIPALCKGFAALGERLYTQVRAVEGLQSRLHEINTSLSLQQQSHDLDISIRAADAKRRHIALSQRCLQIATKVQVLRNRGYVMDSVEERVKETLAQLEQSAFDPALSGRQEEIWARMVGIHERAKILQMETDKASAGLQETGESGIDDDILRRTKKILGDYDSQISHLQREVEEIKKDFADWSGGNTARRP